jgi:hypothetical protein
MRKIFLLGLAVLAICFGSAVNAASDVYIAGDGSCNSVGTTMTLFNTRGTGITATVKQDYNGQNQGNISVPVGAHSKHPLGCSVEGTARRGWTLMSVQ